MKIVYLTSWYLLARAVVQQTLNCLNVSSLAMASHLQFTFQTAASSNLPAWPNHSLNRTFAACRHLPRHFILGQMPAHHNGPVNSNVRPRKQKPVVSKDYKIQMKSKGKVSPASEAKCQRTAKPKFN